MKKKKSPILQALLWVLQGFIVGIGAILPGVSGGSLCYVFGIYDPVLEVLTSPISAVKRHWRLLLFVILGIGLGFVGFAGITHRLLAWNEGIVLCVFIGLILGTLPGLWKDAGAQKRTPASLISLVISFLAILGLFYLFGDVLTLRIPATVWGWLLCGLLWGLSFIVPGFSSSTLLLFFGIYEDMSAGISAFDFGVLIPLGVSMLATLLLFSRLMKLVFHRFHSIASHCVLGFVCATTLMILPSFSVPIHEIVIYLSCIVAGAVASYFFSLACDKMKK